MRHPRFSYKRLGGICVCYDAVSLKQDKNKHEDTWKNYIIGFVYRKNRTQWSTNNGGIFKTQNAALYFVFEAPLIVILASMRFLS